MGNRSITLTAAQEATLTRLAESNYGRTLQEGGLSAALTAQEVFEKIVTDKLALYEKRHDEEDRKTLTAEEVAEAIAARKEGAAPVGP